MPAAGTDRLPTGLLRATSQPYLFKRMHCGGAFVAVAVGALTAKPSLSNLRRASLDEQPCADSQLFASSTLSVFARCSSRPSRVLSSLSTVRAFVSSACS